jgi:hypothetical protein
MQKLGQWYHRNYKHVLNTTNSTLNGAANPFVSLGLADVPKPPRRMAEINYYMKLHYNTRMKSEAYRRFDIAKRDYEGATEEERSEGEMKEPVPLAIQTETAKSFWATESAATKDEVRVGLEATYQEELAAWKADRQLPKTPQEYHQ